MDETWFTTRKFQSVVKGIENVGKCNSTILVPCLEHTDPLVESPTRQKLLDILTMQGGIRLRPTFDEIVQEIFTKASTSGDESFGNLCLITTSSLPYSSTWLTRGSSSGYFYRGAGRSHDQLEAPSSLYGFGTDRIDVHVHDSIISNIGFASKSVTKAILIANSRPNQVRRNNPPSSSTEFDRENVSRPLTRNVDDVGKCTDIAPPTKTCLLLFPDSFPASHIQPDSSVRRLTSGLSRSQIT